MIYCIILTVFSAFHQSVLPVLTHSKRPLPKKLELFTNFDSFKIRTSLWRDIFRNNTVEIKRDSLFKGK